MDIIQSILVYRINHVNKVIGKFENISKKVYLKNIRPKIKKMDENDEFVKPKQNGDLDIFDKDMEDQFRIEDILIVENGEYKINIKRTIRDESYQIEKKKKEQKQINNYINNFII